MRPSKKARAGSFIPHYAGWMQMSAVPGKGLMGFAHRAEGNALHLP
jgi:hypothetical protein